MWPVTLRPKGLGRTRGLGSGSYRLCLGSGVLSLQRKPRVGCSEDARASPQPALRLSLLSVRRCGHADSFFFLELGRSAPTGPGELWLQAPDAVVAQSIHETVLAAMKRLGDGSACGRDASASTNRPCIPLAYESLAPAPASGLTLRGCPPPGECREPAAFLPTLARPGPNAPDGLMRAGGYIRMGARRDYELMGGGEAGGYMVMAPPGPAAHPLQQECVGAEYEPMSHDPPGFVSPARSCSPDGWGVLEPRPCLQPSAPRGELAGEYVCIQQAISGPRGAAPDGRLNYIDLELIPPLQARGTDPGDAPSLHSYARIEFQKLRNLQEAAVSKPGAPQACQTRGGVEVRGPGPKRPT